MEENLEDTIRRATGQLRSNLPSDVLASPSSKATRLAMIDLVEAGLLAMARMSEKEFSLAVEGTTEFRS